MARHRNLNRTLFSVLIIIVVTLTFLSLLASNSFSEAQKPIKGVLDLTDWDFDKDRPSMAGEWEFYWSRLYTYDDFQTMNVDSPQFVLVPNVWNSYNQAGSSLPGFGYATYRLKVIVGDASRPLSLKLDNMSTAYKLFINDNEIASSGKVGRSEASSFPAYHPTTVDFQPPAKEFFVIIQVSNFTYARGGIWYDINLGTRQQIDGLNWMVVNKDAILIGSLLIMALYYLSFYIVLQKDKSSLYFMLLCLIFIIRTSLNGDMMIIRLFPDIPFGLLIFLTYATLYWIPTVIFLMVESVYKCNTRFNFKRAFLIYCFAATAITAILPIHIYTAFVTVIEVIGIGIVIFSVGNVARAYYGQEKGAGLILLAVFVILLTGIHDVLYQANRIHHAYGEMASVGIFLFMFTFSFIIASRLSDAYEKAKNLTLQLAESLKKEKEAADGLVKTELSFLKAQIKPHFLYNSLTVITALSTKDPQRTKELLYDLSDYLRGSFNFENYNGVTPIESELATVRAYLSIEKERFQGKLNVEYHIDESVDITVPLLTIQPLVENAIRHGIMKKTGGGTVTLRIRRAEDSTVIAVKDDGVGIPAGKLAEIIDGTAKLESGVGLKNIQRRLVLHYGHGLEIQSTEGQGTTVTMRIPD